MAREGNKWGRVLILVVAAVLGSLLYNYWGEKPQEAVALPAVTASPELPEESLLPHITQGPQGEEFQISDESFAQEEYSNAQPLENDKEAAPARPGPRRTYSQDGSMEFIWEDEGEPQVKGRRLGPSEVPDDWELVEDRSQSPSAPSAQRTKPSDSASASAKTPASAPAKKGASAKASPKASPPQKLHDFELEIDYPKLLAKPSELGFVPDAELFRDVYFRIRTSFVEQVADAQLEKGVVHEVGKLVRAAGQSPQPLQSLDKRVNILSQVLDLYAPKVDKTLLTYAAIEGMLYGLGDPYSILMTPKEYASLEEQVQTKGFGGIGVYIEADKDQANQVTVFEPMEGTPAAKAGLEPGDQILAIDGQSTQGMALDVATKLIRGPIGSKVVLTIKRPDRAQPFKVSVTRATIHAISCTSKMYGSIGYIRMRQFGASTGRELAQELAKVRSQGAQGLILDLRNNGGGFVQAAIEVGSQFIRRGGLIVYTLDRAQQRDNLVSTADGQVDLPFVVLINRFSASASEITAGALRDHKLARLVGEHSFGKGSVQQIFPFADGSALKMTVARFYSPSGQMIDHQGIEPQVVVKMEPRFVGKEDKDIQLQKALQILKQKR